MLLLNIEYIPGKKIEALGIAKGSVVQSKNFGKGFMAGMKPLAGGEIESYTQMLTEARQIATKRMVDDAEAMGADAVIGIRYTSASVMQGRRRSPPTAPPCASRARRRRTSALYERRPSHAHPSHHCGRRRGLSPPRPAHPPRRRGPLSRRPAGPRFRPSGQGRGRGSKPPLPGSGRRAGRPRVASLRYDKRTFAHGKRLADALQGRLSVEEEVIRDALCAAALLRAEP